MIIYDQWITPSFNQDWKKKENDDNTKHFILNIFLKESGRVDKKNMDEIPEGTTSIKIVIKNDEKWRNSIVKYLDFDKGYIPSSVTRAKIKLYAPFHNEECHGSDGWLPDSVTMLTVPSLPFPAALALKNIRFLKLKTQKEAIELDMVPPTIEYLWFIEEDICSNDEIHSIPNTVKELVVNSYGLQIKPTFTSPIHIRQPRRYDRFRNANELNKTLCDPKTQSITSSTPNIDFTPLPTITSLVIEKHRYFNNSLESLHPLPPQLKYLSLPETYDQPIYQQQNLPISLTHLELSILIYKNNHFTNNWLCRKGYLPPSITHLKIRIFYEIVDNDGDVDDDLEIEKKEEEEINSERNADKEFNNDQDDKTEIDSNITHPLKNKSDQNDGDQDQLVTKQDEYDPLPSSLKILIPSSIQSVCFSFDYKSYRSHVTVLDKDDYYSITPTPPKIRQGLKELVLSKRFNNYILNNTLPSTLQSLSINNPDYNNPLNSNNLPLSLTSFKCNSEKIKLDLSSFESIKELNTLVDAITYYPPNVEALKLKSPSKDGYQKKFNKHLVKSLEYSCKPSSLPYDARYLKKVLPTLPNVQYLSSEIFDFEALVPASVQELKCLHPSFRCTDTRPISSPPFETLHLDLDYYLKNHSQTQDNHQRDEKIINKRIPIQQPMLNTFFKIWRNIYLKPLVLEALYDLTKSPLRFDSETGTLENIDKFKQYNILVDDNTQLGPALLKFDKADEICIYNTTITNLSSFISKSIKKLTCSFTKGIPEWITYLNLGYIRLSDHEVEIPPSVTNLTIHTNDEKYIGKIPPSVRFLTLKKLMHNLAHCIPPSVTHLSLANTAFNSINETDIPSTVLRIKFKKLLYKKDKGEYDIPSFISSRLVNGVFYMYSKSKNRITIPSNTTHLFWLDDQYIDNDGDGINIPPSVHTLVLDETFNSAILPLPPTITQMIFNGDFCQSLYSISFPPTLKYLSFHGGVLDIQEQYLPNGLTHLSIGEFTYDIKSIPQSVHHLEFTKTHEDYPIPPQVKHVKFQSRYHVLTFLPTTIKSFITPNREIFLKDPTDSPLEKSSQVSSFTFISNSTTSIHLYSDYHFNYFILPHTLGNNIKSITFGHSFNQVLLKGAIPNSVEKLVFGGVFNHKLNKSILPTSLLTLVLGRNFDQDLNDNLPSSLTELMLNTESKPSFTSSFQFPPNLKKLALPYYDGVLDIIPTTINHLEFNRNIVKDKQDIIIFPIELVPPHITTLVLNDDIRIQSYDLIPASITCITLCDSITPYTKIPCTVESVVLPISFNQPLDTILQTVNPDLMDGDGELQEPLKAIYFPPSLKYLYFNSLQIDIQENDLPNGLTHLVIDNLGSQIKSLPQSCHHLEFIYQGYDDDDDCNVIPPQIKHLKFAIHYLIKIPPTIQYLMTCSYDEITFIDTIPPLQTCNNVSIKKPSPFFSTTRIHLLSSRNHLLFDTFIMPNRLINNIRSIAFGDMFNQVIVKGIFLNSIEHLDFGNKFNQKLKRSLLPTSLVKLVLGKAFNQDLNDVFPSTLTEISLSMLSKPQIKSSSQFPPNLKKLIIPCYNGVLDIVPTSTIHHLQFNNNIIQNATDSLIFPVELTPPNITTLILNDYLRIERRWN
ncbi:hypothetical protein CYY_007253 [Polysphondylium violaceum]|uniref:FNIP repeat-containing protein n=1 Tax=Polysphondylium violaceum TaxID=133409 RepID=A0A8J4V518_9MYCE|nr:hypothetical protein CYY_007253 [Polysphondylium violaceum]